MVAVSKLGKVLLILRYFSKKSKKKFKFCSNTLKWQFCFHYCIIKKARHGLNISLNPLTTSVLHHIETSQLICNTNQLIGFYTMGNTGR